MSKKILDVQAIWHIVGKEIMLFKKSIAKVSDKMQMNMFCVMH